MQKVELTMTNEEGLHSRPAMEFSKAAANLKARWRLKKMVCLLTRRAC